MLLYILRVILILQKLVNTEMYKHIIHIIYMYNITFVNEN